MNLRNSILSLLALSALLTSCSSASTDAKSPTPDTLSSTPDTLTNVGDWIEYAVTVDGAVIFETGYTESGGATSDMEAMWGVTEYYRFQIGCYPADEESIRLRGEFALQPAVADGEAAYSTGAFGDASDLELAIGASFIDPEIKNLMAGPDEEPPFSIIYFTPEEYGGSDEFSEVLKSGQINVKVQGKPLHFAWPIESGERVIDALTAAGCKV
jgi:hypothetical protein